MSTVNIGTLAGTIEFEDRISATMEKVLDKVERLEARFGGLNTSVKATAGGFILAEAAISLTSKALELGVELVKDFTSEGAAIADVEESFNRLTESANRSGETMLGVLRQGTRSTIDDFTLMTTVNDQFAAGVQLTDEQMKTLAEGGFALAQAKGIDVAKAFDILNTAMLTGQVRAVQQLTGKIDLAKAEDDYAKSLGTTSDRLTSLEKQEAARVAILDKVSDATARIGEQTSGVDEIIAQMTTDVKNFYDELTSGIAASPSVVRAFETVQSAIVNALGGSSDQILAVFLDRIESVADTVTEYAPVVVDWFVRIKDKAVEFYGGAVRAWETFGPFIVASFTMIKDWVITLYNSVISTWDALPDWLKTVAERSALTAVGLVAVSQGAGSLVDSLSSLAGSIGGTISGLKDLPDLAKLTARGFQSMSIWWAVLDFSSLPQTVASFKLLAGSIASTIGPLGIATLYAGALYAAYELGKWEPISDFFFELGLELQGFSQAEQDAMIAAEKATVAQQKQAQETQKQNEASTILADLQEQVAITTQNVTDALNQQGPALANTTDRTKEYGLAWERLEALGTTYQDVLDGVNGNIRASVMEYAELGASVEDLYQAFPQLTKAQAEAAVESVRASQEIRKVYTDTFEIIAKSQGDNINDWIEGERRKLEATLESLRLQGELTDEMLDAQMAKFNATVDAEIAKRSEANKFSKAAFQKEVDEARASLDLMLLDRSNYTDEAIRQAYREVEEKQRALNHWTSTSTAAVEQQTTTVVQETDKQVSAITRVSDAWQRGVDVIVDGIEMVRTLSGELVTLAEKEARRSAGGTFDLKPFTKTELRNLQMQYSPFSLNPNAEDGIWKRLDELEAIEGTVKPDNNKEFFQLQRDAVELARLRQWAKGRERSARTATGTFTSVTQADDRGMTPASGASSGLGGVGSVQNNFYVNGTATEVAKQIEGVIMKQLKGTRLLGAV